MPVETDRERDALLADFGECFIFSPGESFPNRSDKSVNITGIFDNGYYADPGEITSASTSQPTLLCKTSDTEDAARNSMIEKGSKRYKVVAVEPDGTGMTVLQLEGPG